MSEPLSSTEIEDVLSSIRRLVSDDMRPAPRIAAAAAAAAFGVSAEKLILTPALRVVQNEAEVVSPPEVALSPEPALAPDPALSVEPSLSPERPLSLGTPMFVAVPRVQLSLDAVPGRLDGVVASVGAAVDAAPDDWEAEIGDTAPQPDALLGNPWTLPQDDEDILLEAESDPAVAADGDDHFEYHAAQDTPAWAQQDVAADEADAAPAALHGTVEPDAVWADAAEASVIAALAEPEMDPDAAEDDALDLGMRFDEDVLRELVRDMLREELAGKIGERITRNIRKLVRAEIARALASQEFE